MIISKKKFEQMVQERVNQELSRKEYERFIDDRFNHVHDRITELERRIEPTHKGECTLNFPVNC